MTARLLVIAVVTAVTWAIAAESQGQPLGTFTWQLQPFCNVVTVNVTQQGAVYTMDGYDDQCGAARRAPIVGLGTPNPDGTIGLGWNIITTPGGRGVQVDARVTLPSASGSWSDSAGNAGTLALGASTGGASRPLPAAATGIPGAFSLLTDGGFVARGTAGGGIPAAGPGSRMLWHPGKAAFRAGTVFGTQWDDANIGAASVAMGFSTTASGPDGSTAMGNGTVASGQVSTAFGLGTTASGKASTAMGEAGSASGIASTSMGYLASANGTASTAMGHTTTASGYASVAMGQFSVASGDFSTALGRQSTASGPSSTAIGTSISAAGLGSVVMGVRAATTAQGNGSFVYGDQSTGSSGAVVTSSRAHEFLVRAVGGVAFYTNGALTSGVTLATNASQWLGLSDVNSKHGFTDLDGEGVLAKLARIPVMQWSYKTQDASIRHVGPTAQDFHAAFGLGEDPLRIGTMDADGIALAAVKALEARTRQLTRQNDDLRERLVRLEALLEKR